MLLSTPSYIEFLTFLLLISGWSPSLSEIHQLLWWQARMGGSYPGAEWNSCQMCLGVPLERCPSWFGGLFAGFYGSRLDERCATLHLQDKYSNCIAVGPSLGCSPDGWRQRSSELLLGKGQIWFIPMFLRVALIFIVPSYYLHITFILSS